MANYKEIVTKAVKGKGKKSFIDNISINIEHNPSTILGCWIINHSFSGTKEGNRILLNGTYDINVWYSYDNNTKTDVIKESVNYDEVVNINSSALIDGDEEIIVRSIKQPVVIKADIVDGKILCNIEKELGIELVGNTKIRIEEQDADDVWDLISEEKEEDLSKKIDEINEDYL